MYIDANAIDLQDGHTNVRLEGVPDICPRCHRNVHPKAKNSTILRERDLCQTIWRCTHQKCQELFIATYASTGRFTPDRKPIFDLTGTEPWSPRHVDFPKTVIEISPTFIEIYNQAIAAESQGLSQLVGIGLRKSLEFLIKDFACHEHPDEEQPIRAKLLGACIAEYVIDPNIKECARRAAWLGNDEAHYTRKWETRDVSDLKLLVRLTVNWIDNALLTKKYIAEMNGNQA
jgi:hypothetical protein